jgi:hypothetical protein
MTPDPVRSLCFHLQVLVVLVEKGGLFAQHKVVYFVIGTRVRRWCWRHTITVCMDCKKISAYSISFEMLWLLLGLSSSHTSNSWRRH